jgi:molybdopterin-guanine dinucleotide biosynthesis protein A
VSDGPLVCVLAAGLGRRFGGLKALAEVGPNGEALMDLTLADAAAAGFAGIVLITRAEIETEVAGHVRRHSPLPVRVVLQDAHGPHRGLPWGTAHALVAAAEALDAPFAVVNADDLVGPAPIASLYEWLSSPVCQAGQGALVPFELDATVPAAGSVSRAPCRIEAGRLVGIAERTGVHRRDGGFVSDQGPLGASTPVSMNVWGFHPAVLPILAERFAAFAPAHPAPSDAEYRLPDVVGELIAAGALEVAALATGRQWVGITHAADVEIARARLAHAERG